MKHAGIDKVCVIEHCRHTHKYSAHHKTVFVFVVLLGEV